MIKPSNDKISNKTDEKASDREKEKLLLILQEKDTQLNEKQKQITEKQKEIDIMAKINKKMERAREQEKESQEKLRQKYQ